MSYLDVSAVSVCLSDLARSKSSPAVPRLQTMSISYGLKFAFLMPGRTLAGAGRLPGALLSKLQPKTHLSCLLQPCVKAAQRRRELRAPSSLNDFGPRDGAGESGKISLLCMQSSATTSDVQHCFTALASRNHCSTVAAGSLRHQRYEKQHARKTNIADSGRRGPRGRARARF